MELLPYPKSDYLLEASLEALHTESLQWQKEIDFWQDELIFFYKLLNKPEASSTFPKEALAGLEKEVFAINTDQLEKIKNEIQGHENMLTEFIKSNSYTNESAYRDTHKKLYREIYELQGVIRDFKKKVFSSMQKDDV